jgi:hypothetical protein
MGVFSSGPKKCQTPLFLLVWFFPISFMVVLDELVVERSLVEFEGWLYTAIESLYKVIA